MRRRSRSTARTSSTRPARASRSGSGWSCRRRTRIAGRRSRLTRSSGPLTEPAAGFLVAEDAGVLARLKHEVEVAPVDRRLRPPAVDDAPLLAQARDPDAIHAPRDADRARLDE